MFFYIVAEVVRNPGGVKSCSTMVWTLRLTALTLKYTTITVKYTIMIPKYTILNPKSEKPYLTNSDYN